MKFQIGDKIKIKRTLQHGRRYNNCFFNGIDGMYDYLGKHAIIKEVNKEGVSGYYGLNIDDNKWIWSDDMMELVEAHIKEPKIIKQYGIVKFLEGAI